MGIINDKYKNKIEHSVLLNGYPSQNHDIVDGRMIIRPESYSRPEISDAEQETILNELADDLKHYGLQVTHLNDKFLQVSSGDFVIEVPKSLVIPYDDDIFANILRQQQLYYSNRLG